MNMRQRTTRIPSRLLMTVAVLGALVFHGGLSLFGTYRNTYDAYVHIFFADHWRRAWFDHWETRWYTGFPMTSYPPLSQQSVAALSFLTGDLRLAFAIVQTAAMMLMTVGMVRFARLWVSDEAAGWAGVWLVFSTAMAETIHVFGQLPTTFSLALLLNALPFAYRWIRSGRTSDLLKAWALVAATTGAHHVTTLFGSVFIIAPVLVLALMQEFRQPLPDEGAFHPRCITRGNWRAVVMRRLRRLAVPTLRTGVFGVGMIVLLFLVVLPYWLWSRSDPITQVPIPLASRDNFLVNLNAGLVFWLIPYGLLLVTAPYVVYKGLTTKAWPLLASIGLLAFLGTGGTTPFPKLLLRGAFDILTLDRFTLWASILMLPLAGEFVVSLRRGGLAAWIEAQFGRITLAAAQGGLAVALLVLALLVSSLTQFRKFQPAPIDMSPIVSFLNKDQHDRWRFITLGFGDQMAWLSAQTTATQVDGNYHSARRLPELTTTPVERLEGAKYSGVPGIGSLQQVLAAPDKYNLKFVFSNDQFYDPLLFFYGWQNIGVLENGIAIWEREDIPVLPATLPRREIPVYQRIMFGTLPPLALLLALLTTTAGVWLLPFRLLGELAGLRRPHWPRLLPLGALVRTAWDRFDTWMRSAAQLEGSEREKSPHWQVSLRALFRHWRRRLRPASLRARHIRAAFLAVTILLAAGGGILWWRSLADTPVHVVEQYYDDLDFRRFEAAYGRLDPVARPPLSRYIVDLSLQGGIVASYGKLNAIDVQVVEQSGARATVDATATYITALAYYTDTQRLDLTHTAAGWRIEPPPALAAQPAEQFVRQPQIGYLARSGRQPLNPAAPLLPTADRPDVQIVSSRMVVTEEGRFSVVGEVRSRDADPADLTIRATIYDTTGTVLTWYNAADVAIHKLLPYETVPFRVDFEGVAGLALEDAGKSLSFTPGARTDYRLPEGVHIGSYNVFAKAVAAVYDLDRSVGVEDIRFLPEGEEDQGWVLHGRLINTGLQAAVIPHILVTLYDAKGEVAWVDHTYLRQWVPAQETLDFAMPLTPAANLRGLPLVDPAQDAASDTGASEDLAARPDLIPLPHESGYAYARISVNYYTGHS